MYSKLLLPLAIALTLAPSTLSAPLSSTPAQQPEPRDGLYGPSPDTPTTLIEKRISIPSDPPQPVPGINAHLAGWQPEPDTSGMSSDEAETALQNYQNQQASTPAGQAHAAANAAGNRLQGEIAHDDTH